MNSDDIREPREVLVLHISLEIPHRAARFAQIMRQAAREEIDTADAAKWSDIADRVGRQAGTRRVYRKRVVRPLVDDSVALERVIRGEAPYPVLSAADTRRAFVALWQQLIPNELGSRLHVDSNTIRRWRKKYEEEQKENGTWPETS